MCNTVRLTLTAACVLFFFECFSVASVLDCRRRPPAGCVGGTADGPAVSVSCCEPLPPGGGTEMADPSGALPLSGLRGGSGWPADPGTATAASASPSNRSSGRHTPNNAKALALPDWKKAVHCASRSVKPTVSAPACASAAVRACDSATTFASAAAKSERNPASAAAACLLAVSDASVASRTAALSEAASYARCNSMSLSE